MKITALICNVNANLLVQSSRFSYGHKSPFLFNCSDSSNSYLPIHSFLRFHLEKWKKISPLIFSLPGGLFEKKVILCFIIKCLYLLDIIILLCFTELSLVYTKRNLFQCFRLWEMITLFNRLVLYCSKSIIKIHLYLITVNMSPNPQSTS